MRWGGRGGTEAEEAPFLSCRTGSPEVGRLGGDDDHPAQFSNDDRSICSIPDSLTVPAQILQRTVTGDQVFLICEKADE